MPEREFDATRYGEKDLVLLRNKFQDILKDPKTQKHARDKIMKQLAAVNRRLNHLTRRKLQLDVLKKRMERQKRKPR
jgi:hypothetical protein